MGYGKLWNWTVLDLNPNLALGGMAFDQPHPCYSQLTLEGPCKD